MSARQSEVRISADSIPVSGKADATIAVVGTPNCGKSTLFNRLTGLKQRIGNYPGVTVERHVGTLKTGDASFELIDLPGTHGLSAHSLEEHIAVDVIFGRMEGTRAPDGILAVIDSTNLYQGLFLARQLVELELPVVVALTMTDAAEISGITIDEEALGVALGDVPVIKVVATTGAGVDTLRQVVGGITDLTLPQPASIWPELEETVAKLVAEAPQPIRSAEVSRLIIDGLTTPDDLLMGRLGIDDHGVMMGVRERLFGNEPPLAREARIRYAWVQETLTRVQQDAKPVITWRSRITSFFNRPVPGTIGLFVVMAIVFQAVFAWATPVMDVIDAATVALGGMVTASMGDGALASLVADGVIAGVGSVVIFLPQIVILFLFIILLEDSGYLARAAYLLDRAMRMVGLSGQSIIPMISSFACAVPGIMATRVIPNRRDRIATILAAPFMTCSARLPVYALLIAAFVPQQTIGWLNLQGLVLFGLYLFGIIAGVFTALLMRRTALRGPKPPFALMLPEFRRPNLQTVFIQLLGRVKVFLYRAGTVIFTVAVVVWVLAYYPRSDALEPFVEEQVAVAEQTLRGDALDAAIADIENLAAARQMEQSWLGRIGRFVEPVFVPLGWDWRVSSAVIAGFPAREVVVAVLGTVYAVGDQADNATLSARLQSATWPDGTPVFTLPMVLGLLVFYACCLQCAATLAVIYRETNTWRWPVFAWLYMTGVGYVGAMIIFQVGSAG